MVRVVAIVVSPRRLATLWAGLGVTLFLEHNLELLLVIGGGAEPYLLVVAAAAGSAERNFQVVRSQPRGDLQHGLRAAVLVGQDLGADVVRPAPLLPRRRLVHLEEQCLDGYAHLGLSDALEQLVHGLVVPIDEAGRCCSALPRLHWRAGGRAGARPLLRLNVLLLEDVEGSSAGSVHTNLVKVHQEEQDLHAMRCTEVAW